MSNNQINRELIINTLWSFFGRFGYLIVALISNIILVRLLSPEEFGQASIVLFFVIIANILVESGLSGALVRNQKAEDIDYSTVFIFNLVISVILMLMLIAGSTYIAKFYDDDSLISLVKISSLILLINAFRIVQYVRLIKDLNFKAKSIYEIIAITVGSIVAILAAINGAGASSLVILQLTTATVLTVILWVSVGPLTSFRFSWNSFRKVYSFGINTTLSLLIDKVFDNSYQLIFAKYFTMSQAGFFYQAKKLQEMPMGVIQGSVLGVVFATLCKVQDNKNKFNQLYSQVVRIFTVAVALICLIIFLYANLIVETLYGHNWITSATYLKILITAAFFYFQEIFNRIVFKVFDRTDVILKLEILKKIFLTLTIIYGIYTSNISNLLYGFAITSVFSFCLNYYFSRAIHDFDHFWTEFIIVLKVFSISVITITFGLYLIDSLMWQGFYQLFSLPFVILAYLLLLQLMRVMDLHKDITLFKEFFKKEL